MGRALAVLKMLLVAIAVLVQSSGFKPAAGFETSWFKWMSSAGKRTLVQDYDLINLHLVRRVRNDSPEANLAEARNLLREYQAGKREEGGVEMPSDLALVMFTDLTNLLDPEESHCDLFARNILSDNERATGSDVFRPINERRALRRIGMVIYQVAYQHAEECFREYPRKFAKMFAQARKKPMRDIHQMMRAMIASRDLRVRGAEMMDWRLVDVLKARQISVTGPDEVRALLNYLRTKSKGTEEENFLVAGSHPTKRDYLVVYDDKVISTVNKLLFSRCQFLSHHFESVFKPAELDLRLFQEKHRYRPTSENTANFMVWFEYFRLCADMLTNQRQLQSAIIKAISDEIDGS